MRFVPTWSSVGLQAVATGTKRHDEVRMHQSTLLILAVALIAWSAVMTVLVGLCATAAAGDRAVDRALAAAARRRRERDRFPRSA